MSETQETSGRNPNRSTSTTASQAAWFCGWLREGSEKAMEAFGPPEAAAKHFRAARLEILRGIRDLIDSRIEHLSKSERKGDRIVVE